MRVCVEDRGFVCMDLVWGFWRGLICCLDLN
jgi:hypothetical protein